MGDREPVTMAQGVPRMSGVSLSETIEAARSDMMTIRGRLADLRRDHPGWSSNCQMVEGLLTCGLVTLAWVRDQMQAVEQQRDRETA